jgi:hypothetical protein
MKKKLYIVLWTDKARAMYEVPKREKIVNVETNPPIKVGGTYANALAIFDKKKEAIAFKEGNVDWVIVIKEVVI